MKKIMKQKYRKLKQDPSPDVQQSQGKAKNFGSENLNRFIDLNDASSNQGNKLSSFAKHHYKKPKKPLDLETVVLKSIIDMQEVFLTDLEGGGDSKENYDQCLTLIELKKDNIKQNGLIFSSEVDYEQRARLLDHMLQIFRVLKKSTDQTYFLSVRIFDIFFRIMNRDNIIVKRDQAHLIGLTCLFIASKFEDLVPIRMKQMIKDASHLKYSARDIISSE